MEAARRFLCPQGGAPARGMGGRCRPATAVAGSASATGWDAGLPAPAYRQLRCPDGTIAIAARARPEATRCVPH